TRATHGDPQGRLRSKMGLIRRLYQSGRGRDQVLELFRFIDWVLELPAELVEPFEDEVERLEAELKVSYVTTWERRGIRQGEAALLKSQLVHRFDHLPAWTERRLEEAGREELERWGKRVLDAKAIEEVFAR
ncbi:MAG: hypothetical protein GY856_04520, partial [bacterium]|nr:hypothetical protein [bacterium]